MLKTILVYGVLSGAVIIGSAILSLSLSEGNTHLGTLVWLGYLVMLIGLSTIFIGIKRYRDQQGGGVIQFWTALRVGLGISVVAAVIYVGVWEVNLAATDYQFIDQYNARTLAEAKEQGATPAELEATIAKGVSTKECYDKPLCRVGVTFAEIFPVGLLISLISAGILRNSRVLPAARPAG